MGPNTNWINEDYRGVILLSVMVLVSSSVAYLSSLQDNSQYNNAYATTPINFKLDGIGSAFKITDNQNLISLYSNNVSLESSSPFKQLELKINSDNQLKISEVDIYYNNQEHKLFDTKSDVNNLIITSDMSLIESSYIFQSQIMSPRIGIEDANQHLAFLNSTDYKIDVPQGNSVFSISMRGNPKLTIDDETFSPIINMTNKIIEIHLTSDGSRVIPITGNYIIQSTWNKIEIVSNNYPLNLKTYNTSGKLGITGNDKDVELSSTDTLTFDQLQGTTDISNGQNYQIKVTSSGFSKSILQNDVDILTKLELNNWYGNPIIQGIISAVVGGVILSAIFSLKKLRKSDEFGFTLEKFFENENEYVRILHPSKTIEACLILCNNEPCKWWDDNSVLPRHIRMSGGGNVLLPKYAESMNSIIKVKSGKRTIRKMKLKDIVQTHP